MNTAPSTIRDLARRLIALELAGDPSDEPVDEVARACAKLRGPLAKLAGIAGFQSLMTRAVALAAVEVPWLKSVQVRADGSVEGFDAVRRQHGAGRADEAGVVVVAQLLWLLVTFIGEPLTLRLVLDAWPDALVAATEPKVEE